MEESPGQWLEEALGDLCNKMETGLALDADMISGLVSYCEFAQPLDAKEYLDNIIGEKTGKTVIEEYLRRRGHTVSEESPPASQSQPQPQLHAYVKPSQREKAAKKKAVAVQAAKKTTVSKEKRKGVRAVSLAEAAKGAIVFRRGEACECEARRHSLVGNCLSCGRIVCEQEGEGPCRFCGALVLCDGSDYAGLAHAPLPALSDSEAVAEAYAKRLVDYDRNSAARTTVIDDQSDYYEIEGSSWLSPEEKELLRKKREAIEEEEEEKRRRVVMTFDLVGRKVLVNKDEVDELESGSGILRPPDEREVNRIKPNPTLKVQPVFMDPGPTRKIPKKGSKKSTNKSPTNGMSLEITGRVQHESNELKLFETNDQTEMDPSKGTEWKSPSTSGTGVVDHDGDCSLDYR